MKGVHLSLIIKCFADKKNSFVPHVLIKLAVIYYVRTL